MAAESKTKHYVNVFLRYFVLILVGLIMIYPLVWMVGATFKSNAEIFSSIGFIPKNPTLEGYKKAMESYGGAINVWKAMLNTFSYVIPKVVLNVPQFIMFSKMGWVDSKLYLPIIVPTLFATDTLFVFQLIQFLRNVPKELDEAAKIDGCNAVQTLVKVIVPMLSPAITSIALFQFMWSSNDFMGPLLYVNTPAKYPLAIFVKMSMDADSGFQWNRILALSLISIIPSLVVFFMAQDKFVDGITAGGVKG